MKCKNCGYCKLSHHNSPDCKQFIQNHSPKASVNMHTDSSEVEMVKHSPEDKDPDENSRKIPDIVRVPRINGEDSGSAFINKSQQGKKNRLSGAAFERRVRKDLEAEGWIVDKWTNNVEFKEVEDWGYDSVCIMEREGKLHPAKSFRGITRSNGFPDFIAFRDYPDCWECDNKEVIGVEVKTNGILSKIEKERCSWYLDNNIFSKILIASKSEFAENNIVYKEYERGLKKNDN